MKLSSIRTRFILVISVLTAVILALQLYFINQTQKDVLGELNRFSRSLNMVTDELLKSPAMGDLRPPDPAVRDSSFMKMEWPVAVPDSMAVTLTGNGLFTRNNLRLSENLDSLKKHLKVLDIRLNRLKNDKRQMVLSRIKAESPRSQRATIAKSHGDEEEDDETIELFIPAISGSSSHLMRFTYSTATMQEALEDIRNRNILISVLLLLVAMGTIGLLANRFSAPIKRLQYSFEKVVEGDLSVHVDAHGGDEIARLAHAFNHMVDELRKNREKEASLRHKERLASLGQLAAGVAHEIRNPLNAISLTIQHLEDRFMRDDDDSRQYVRIIQEEIKRLDQTVGTFLGYLRNEKLNRRPEDMTRFINDILHLYRRELEKQNIRVVFEPPEHCRFMIDAGRFKTVIINILINALQAMPAGGRLEIGLDCERKMLWLEDSGTGIDPGLREHIFDLYYTTKSSGTGLGLPTAYKIVKAHGGDIAIHSKLKQGTRVTITLDKDENTDH